MCLTIQVHESGRVDYGLELWDSCKFTKLPQPWHACTTIFNLKNLDMFAQLFYTIDTFPYDNVMTIWINKKNKKRSFGLMCYGHHWQIRHSINSQIGMKP
jgi:hypothetical protein